MLQVNVYGPLTLREAFNKIAHADPETADYYIRGNPLTINHDLLLFGEYRNRKWFAVVSIIELIKAIRSLPDTNVVS